MGSVVGRRSRPCEGPPSPVCDSSVLLEASKAPAASTLSGDAAADGSIVEPCVQKAVEPAEPVVLPRFADENHQTTQLSTQSCAQPAGQPSEGATDADEEASRPADNLACERAANNDFDTLAARETALEAEEVDQELTASLVAAVDAEDWEVAARVLETPAKIDVSARTTWNTSLLRAAAEEGALEVCRLLLEHRSDVNARDGNAMTPLMGAAVGGDRPEIITLLLRARADTKATTDDGFTALAWAHRLDNQSQTTNILLIEDPSVGRYPMEKGRM